MDLNKLIAAATHEFKQKIIACGDKLDQEQLTPELAEQMTQGIKEALAAAGVAALQTFLESYEVEAETLAVEDTLYRYKQPSGKLFLTPFGPMWLTRNLYQADRGGPSYVPLDHHWGMVGQFATVDVREAVLFGCAHITPEETVQVLDKTALFHPSPTAIKHIVEAMGVWMEAEAEPVQAAIRQEEAVPEETEVMVASLDGTKVLLNQPGAKQGRPAERPQRKAPSADEEVASSAKHAMVGSISWYGAPKEETHEPNRLRSCYVGQMPESKAPIFKARFEAELTHWETHLPDTVDKILLLDGHRGLWSYADQPRFDTYYKAIDFYHTTEHLSKAAEALFGKGKPQAQQWYDTYYDKLLEEDNAGQRVLCSIDYYQAKLNLSKTRQQAVDTERTFFRRNHHRMPYAEFRRRGWPIGSGPVEAAGKTLVKTRLCRSGMRWSWNGGQRILQLRTYVKSGRWEPFWKQYKQRLYDAYALAA